MASTHKTKAEILQELESIKGLLLEQDDIPILQEMEEDQLPTNLANHETQHDHEILQLPQHESVLPGQGSLFDEPTRETSQPSLSHQSLKTEHTETHSSPADQQEHRKHGFASHLNPLHSPQPQTSNSSRPLAKASGENPFLPQHIRDRLHGNNPPPLFEYETAKKIITATKNIAHKINKPRQHLIDDVINGMMPQIEAELRHRLFAMSVEDLEKLLNEDEDL